MKNSRLQSLCRGSALIVALIFAAVLVAISSASFTFVLRKYRAAHQAASWHEALLSAEAGVELALNEIRRPLYDPDGPPFAGWDSDTGAHSLRHSSRELLRTGEGGTKSYCVVRVDEPPFLQRNGDQWFRVRSTGITELTGGAIVSGDEADRHLRLFNLRYNSRVKEADARLSRPQARRDIEAIVKPVHAFSLALFGIKRIDLTNHNIVVDSYDSRDPAHSSLGDINPKTGMPYQEGIYVPSERKENGDIATNGKVINAGNGHVYGNASTNGGTAGNDGVLDAKNVSGETRNDFFQEILPVNRPNVIPSPRTPAVISGDTVIQATPTTPVQVVVPSIILTGQDGLRIRGARDPEDKPLLDARGKYVETFAQLVVDGDISLRGQGHFIVDEGVYVRIFVAGNVHIGGNGILNNNAPLHLQIYGLDPPENASQRVKTIHISGNGGFSGAIYAPHYEVEIKGGGNNDNIYGAFVGDTVRMTGVQSVHYDEALADGGLVTNYKIVSWFEEGR